MDSDGSDPSSIEKEDNAVQLQDNDKPEDPPTDEPVLLESVSVPPPKDYEQSNSREGSPDRDNSTLENCEAENGEPDDPLKSSIDTVEGTEPSSVTTSSNPDLTNDSPNITSFINTSSDSMIHHADVLPTTSTASVASHTTNQQTNHTQTTEQLDRPDNERSDAQESGQHVQAPPKGVYSSVVSPQRARRALSPLNTLSLEQEMNQQQQPKQHNGEENQPVDQPSQVSADSPPGVDDRSLEKFSEILLDTDLSQSDGETESVPTKSKKSAKKVRFADEVKEKEVGTSRSSTHSPPPLPTLPTLSSPEDVARQARVPVSPSSPKNITIMSPQHTTNELIAGVEYPAEYLGSTPIYLSGVASDKSSRMYQAQQAVKLIKDPDSDGRPRFSVNVKVSTQAVKIADSKTDVDMMEHPLHTISYVADIDNVLVVMAHVIPPPETMLQSPVDQTATVENKEEMVSSYIPKMTCHVLDTDNARHVAMVIGQAFSAAYKQFLRSNGISEESLEEAEYAHILNAQAVPQVEVESFNDRNKTKKLTLAKHKGELMGVMVMESGYGSAIPSCVIAHLSKNGAAKKSGLLNIGDHIISINGVNLVGMPKKTCIEQLKKCRYQVVVKMSVCSCPAVVEVTIVRPDLKYQLGFSVQKGMITSLIRGSIAERSGIRVGHRIIEINGTSTVSMHHDNIVHLLSSTVGDLHLKTMHDLMYKLLTGQIVPEYH